MSWFSSSDEAHERGKNAKYLGRDDAVFKGGLPVDVTLEQRKAFFEGFGKTHGDPANEAEWEDGAYDD